LIGSPPTLTVRRIIRAAPDELFELWTRPERLKTWWGPAGVTCPHADIDLRPGGAYRIANAFPDGRIIVIAGLFEVIEPPELLVFSWSIEASDSPPERVSVRFDALSDGQGTEVTVLHERIASSEARKSHEAGWLGCLDGLERLFLP
jgi:uncharacterized protein YndB with AHSA1/START domain